jgi:hypothetical protein
MFKGKIDICSLVQHICMAGLLNRAKKSAISWQRLITLKLNSRLIMGRVWVGSQLHVHRLVL